MSLSARCPLTSIVFFFFNDTATTEIYTLSLHDALPIYADDFVLAGAAHAVFVRSPHAHARIKKVSTASAAARPGRSEEHTSELQSRQYLVCRLLLEKKKKLRIKIRCKATRKTFERTSGR